MIGTQIGQLTVVSFIGAGGQGELYLARHRIAGIHRAVKFLRPELASNPTVVARFVQEAQACISIRHDNLLTIHDVGQLDNGRWYLVMDYCGDMTLGRLLAERAAPIPLEECVQIIDGICNGLAYAHARGLVHRDLKPENVLIADGVPILIDWGIAKLATANHIAGPLTKTDVAMGTPAYMAPEQMLDPRSVGPAADIWAVTCIAYQMLTGGSLPYQRESTAAYYMLSIVELHRRTDHPPIDPRQHAPSIPGAVVRVLFAGLAQDPARRIGSASDLASRLRAAMATADDPDIDLVETARSPARRPPTHLDTAGNDNSRTLSKYQLGTKLGEGGMADVFLATVLGEEGFTRQVAVKRVKPEFAMHPLFGPMFISEARVASRLHHANIVPVLDLEKDEAGRHFIVMEYVEGKDLVSLARAGHIPFSTTIYVIGEVLRALEYAHNLPDIGDGIKMVVHRDVSPQNILLSWEGAVKLSDFGIAKARGVADQTNTGSGVKGKVAYMAPEQANAKRNVDGRLDLYAVGIVLWELLAGQQLYTGDTNAIFAQILIYKTKPPTDVRANIPRDLEAVVMKLLEKEPEARYQTAAEARAALFACDAAPKDGRGELVELLAKRFRSIVRAHARGESVPPGEIQRAAAQLTVPQPVVTTLGSAVSDSVVRAEPHRRRAATIVALGLLASVAVAVTLFVVGRSLRRSSDGSTDVVATVQVPAPSPDGTTTARDLGSASNDAASLDAASAASVAAIDDAPARHADAAIAIAMGHDASIVVDAAVRVAVTHDASIAPDGPSHVAIVRDAGIGPHSHQVPRPGPDAAVQPRVVSSSQTGTLVVHVSPWANVTIDGTIDAQETPVTIDLPVGTHRVKLKNDDAEKTINVIIYNSKTTTVDQNL